MNIQSEVELHLFSKTKAASLLGIGKTKLNNLISNGSLAVLRLDGRIRIPGSAIKSFIDENLIYEKNPSPLQKEELITVNNGFDSRNYFNQLITE